MHDKNAILLKANKIVKILKKREIIVAKTKNSHRLLVDKNGKRTTILSDNVIISPILLDKILKDLNIEWEDFIDNM